MSLGFTKEYISTAIHNSLKQFLEHLREPSRSGNFHSLPLPIVTPWEAQVTSIRFEVNFFPPKQ